MIKKLFHKGVLYALVSLFFVVVSVVAIWYLQGIHNILLTMVN